MTMSPGPETLSAPPAFPPIIETMGSRVLQPIGPAERIETLDVLRGFALFGILMVNMELFGWPIYQMFTGTRAWTARPDLIVDWLVRLLMQGKFYLLFSFLFGLGAAVQFARAEERGVRSGGFFCRRLLVLLGIGLAHAFLIWEGDILVCYALCGFMLLAFRSCKPRTILIWAAVFSLIPLLIYTGIWLLITLVSLVPESAKPIREEFARQNAAFAALTEKDIHVFSQGTVGEIFVARARNVFFTWQCLFAYAPAVVGMFLVGLYAGKRRLLHQPEANLRLLRRTLLWGLLIGLPTGVAYAIASGSSNTFTVNLRFWAGMTALSINGPALCLAYVATLALLLRRDGWKRRLRPLAAAGQMGLTNYLLQSLVCTFLFYSYGLGWYGSVGRASSAGLALLIYAAQLPLSSWWLNRFRFGPAEWLWRSLTYRKPQPMRLSGN